MEVSRIGIDKMKLTPCLPQPQTYLCLEKLDNNITAIEVLYDRLTEEMKTQANLADAMAKLKNYTQVKLKATEDKFTKEEDHSRRNNLIS